MPQQKCFPVLVVLNSMMLSPSTFQKLPSYDLDYDQSWPCLSSLSLLSISSPSTFPYFHSDRHSVLQQRDLGGGLGNDFWMILQQ